MEKYLEPADKKIPKILRPESLQANQEFYENLRTGLRQLARDKPSQDAQYSKNLGRVEFGSLKKKPNQMWSDSNTVVVPREDSGDRGRSISMLSDHSTALPDLEVSQEVMREARMEVRMVEEEVLSQTEAEHPVESRQTGSVLQDVPAASDNLPSYSEAGTEVEGKKQQLSDAKAWIQNSLITVVGFGVLAYLQTLEASAWTE